MLPGGLDNLSNWPSQVVRRKNTVHKHRQCCDDRLAVKTLNIVWENLNLLECEVASLWKTSPSIAFKLLNAF